jgi:hypothetical protein
MKNLVKIALLAGGIFSFTAGNAQTKKDTTVGQHIGHAAKKVGHATAHTAALGAAAVTDKKYDDKRGPHGESVYIDKHSRYFYVNKRGHRVYIKKSQIRDKSEFKN